MNLSDKAKLALKIFPLVPAAQLHKEKLLPSRIRPMLAEVQLTENCNSRCMTCDYWKDHYPQSISFERATRLLSEFNELGIRSLRFAGGEPLIRKDFWNILDSCRPEWFSRIVLATNGLLLGKNIDELNNSIVTHVTISIDGFKDVNDYIRGVPGYFDRAVDAISRVTRKKRIVATITNKLIPSLADFIDYCRGLGAEFDFNIIGEELKFNSSAAEMRNVRQLIPNPAEMEHAFSILEEKSVGNIALIRNARKYYFTKTFDYEHCMLGFTSIKIDSGGNVRTGCHSFDPVANINSTSLSDILGSKEYRDDAIKMFRFDCPGCSCGYSISAAINHPLALFRYSVNRISQS
ncbi:radical SAM protein [Sphingomonas sp. JC676]|uniref:radical SAM protein n=1 Tax=Sphingomonas sp. JC676 TaxID=2768065 RepID=UPI001657777F|nr:radical SAM protein [Sphingomonas sp. JC676]MBC9030963.1 radical SAM protein [Sphingomonas sp. JC676]